MSCTWVANPAFCRHLATKQGCMERYLCQQMRYGAEVKMKHEVFQRHNMKMLQYEILQTASIMQIKNICICIS